MAKRPLANAFFARNAANCWRKRRRPLAGCVRWKQNTNVPEVRGERVAPPRRCLPRIGWNMLMSGEAKREPTPDKCTRPFVTRDFVLSTFSHRSTTTTTTTTPRRSVRSFDPRHRPPLSKPFAAFYLVVPIDENSAFSLSNLSPTVSNRKFSQQCLSRELRTFRLRILCARRSSTLRFSLPFKKKNNFNNIRQYFSSIDKKYSLNLKHLRTEFIISFIRSIIRSGANCWKREPNATNNHIFPIPKSMVKFELSTANFLERQNFLDSTISWDRSEGRKGEEWRGGEGEVKRWNKSWHLPAFSRYERRVIRLIMGSACIHARGCAVLFYGGVGWTANDRVFTVNHDI